MKNVLPPSYDWDMTHGPIDADESAQNRDRVIKVIEDLLVIARLAQYYAPGDIGEMPKKVSAVIDSARDLMLEMKHESKGD